MNNRQAITRRQFLKSSALAAGALTLAACAAPAAPVSAPTAGESQPATVSKTPLNLWHFLSGAYAQVLENVAASWNEKNASFEMTVRAIPIAEFKREIATALAAGTPPDIAGIDNPDHASFAALGAFIDISDRFSAMENNDQYLPGPLLSTIWDGKHFGIPGDTNTLALYINVDMVEAAGLDIAVPPTNWEDLTRWATILSNASTGVYGIAFSARQSEEGTFQWLPFLWQNGEDLATIDSPAAVEALQLWVDWVNNGLASREVINYTQGDAIGQFKAGTAAMCINGSWQIPTLRDPANTVKWTVVELPFSKQPASAMGGGNWAIFNGTKDADATWDFLMQWTLPSAVEEIYLPAGRIPPRRDLLQAGQPWVGDEAYQTFFRQLEYARPRGPQPRWPDISAAIQKAIQDSLTGQASATESLAIAASTIRPLLQ